MDVKKCYRVAGVGLQLLPFKPISHEYWMIYYINLNSYFSKYLLKVFRLQRTNFQGKNNHKVTIDVGSGLKMNVARSYIILR